MSANFNDESDRQDRLNEILLAYIEAAQVGRAPDQSRLLAENPELRPELEEFFACRDEVERLAAPLRDSVHGGGLASGGGKAAEVVPGGSSPTTDHPAPATGPLGELGDFRLLREVGRGGMGVVYEAEQISLRRRVALKVLPFAAAIDSRQLQRFQNEALAAAHLRHEHIVPVFAVGSDRGVHYYAMQFIDGQSLAALIAELRRAAWPAEPSGPAGQAAPAAAETHRAAADQATAVSASLDRSTRGRKYFRWVAGLARQAALALEHAHQMGVVHRDVKPANLLLDPRGELWVTDFGLAQMGSDAGLTMTGELLGTLRYASPEQALGRRGLVDHRSDVYSLGATLYELLTLRPIFDGRDRHELLRQIADTEPTPPRSLDRAIPEELETIILKAVAKEPGERYSTAQELADDLERFREDRPIRARRPSLAEKATKWARRHRAVVASALAALVLTMAGLAAATVLTVRAYDRERLKAEEADEQRGRAQENFRQALGAVDRFARFAEEELAGYPELESVRRRLLEVALTYYQDFIDQRRDDPSSQQELQASRAKAERILGELATLAGAARFFPLHLREVQDELDLSPEKREALARIDRRMREAFQRSFTQSPEAWDQQRLALAREQEEVIPKLLSAAEFRRFEQVLLQMAGVGAFSDPKVEQALQLTAEQKARIRVFLDEQKLAGPGPRGGPGRPPGHPDDARRREEARRRAEETREKILALLTAEQKSKWQELVGKLLADAAGRLPHLPPPPGR
jgi:serine/threonine protein kinase